MDLKAKGFSRATELANHKIKSIEEGKELVAEIEQTMGEILDKLREGHVTNDIHQQYTDLHYEYKNARHNIQKQLGNLVKLKLRKSA